MRLFVSVYIYMQEAPERDYPLESMSGTSRGERWVYIHVLMVSKLYRRSPRYLTPCQLTCIMIRVPQCILPAACIYCSDPGGREAIMVVFLQERTAGGKITTLSLVLFPSIVTLYLSQPYIPPTTTMHKEMEKNRLQKRYHHPPSLLYFPRC